jgi:cellulose synthase (UDP-forming)
MMKSSGSGDTAEVASVGMPPARVAYDAPRWIPTERDVHLTDGMADSALQLHGNGAVNFYFRLPPDIYYGSRETVPFHLRYRCGLNSQSGKAEIRIFLNGALVAQRPITWGSEIEVRDAIIPLPAISLYAGNTLSVEFAFDGRSNGSGRLPDPAVRTTSKAVVLRGTGLIVQGMSHFVEMPRLDLFANSGFPFTRMADLSQTLVMLPPSHRADAVSVFLSAMGFMGAQTGYPALRVTVSDTGVLPEGSDKDILIIGSFENQPALGALGSRLAVQSRGNALSVNPVAAPLDDPAELLSWRSDSKNQRILEIRH